MTTELAPHQITATERALELLRRRGGLILADDVGLGKSFVAAAVAARTSASIELIVPASLVAQWQTTLDAFGIDAPITTPDRIIHEPFAPHIEGERLIVVDEAHVFRNSQTQRYDALARRSIGARLLLVTATPICNTPEDLHALVSLIAADDALRSAGVASIEEAFRLRSHQQVATIMSELVIRRGREVLDDDLRFGRLERQIVWHDVPDAPIDALTFPLIGGHASLLRGLLWRRLESSGAALLDSVRRQKRFYERALDCLAAGRTLTKHDYRKVFGDEDADAFQEVLFWDAFATDQGRVDAEEIRTELQRLDAVRSAVEQMPRNKTASLVELCVSTIDPLLIFTSAIATANDIFGNLTRVRRAGMVTSHGSMPSNAIDAFTRGALDVLVCTDLAAEGLNLQRAGMVVHYDMPWNPVRIDQRNGRAFRIGQQRDVVRAIYFLARGRHTRVVQVVASKNRARRRVFRGAPPSPAVSLAALPQRLPRSSPAVVLLDALRRHGLRPPVALARRYRAGIERVFAAMAGEYLDGRRVSDLTLLLERERIIADGISSGPSDR